MLVADQGLRLHRRRRRQEYFFHRSAVEGPFEELREGDLVGFEPEPVAPKGPRAKRLTVGPVPSASAGAAEAATP